MGNLDTSSLYYIFPMVNQVRVGPQYPLLCDSKYGKTKTSHYS